MIKSYLRIAFRNLAKNKAYSIINITGLAVGLASFMIILLYLNYELSYDKWADSLKQVYKISLQKDNDILEQTPAPLGSLLKQNLPGIEAATTIQPDGDFEALLSVGDKKIYQKGGVTADSSFFKVFPYKMVTGVVATALNKPNAIVISKELAEKLFDNTDPIGKTIKIYNAFDCEVTGILQTPDKPSHLNVQFVYRSPFEKQNMFWQNYSYLTYVKTKQGIPVEQLEQEINRVYYNDRLKKDKSFEEFSKAGNGTALFADAMPNLHNFPKHGSSNFRTVSMLLILTVLLLIAGAINFSNLSVAASVKRAKEVGIRKVLGGNKKQLLLQFIGEVAIQCFISLCLAVLLVNSMLPYFNNLFSVHLSFLQSDNNGSLVLQLALCLLFVIIISGLYPAVFLARYNIIKVLKGDYSTGTKSVVFRNVLITAQFVVAAFFIISTLIISGQVQYMRTKDKGFSGEQVMRLEATQKTRDADFEMVQNTLLGIPGVQSVSKTTAVPGDAISDTSTIPFKYNGKECRMGSVKVSADYFKTLSIALVQGRMFDNTYADQNTRSAIINEAAAKRLNLQSAAGAYITFPYCDTVPVNIIGVVKNFNVSGFENIVQPAVYTIGNKACRFQSGGALLVKINSNNIHQSVAAIEKVWKTIEPDYPIRYSFLNDNFQKIFSQHVRLQRVINFFAMTAMLISVIGLFAMTAFLMSSRTKEISIRKVLGAGVGNLSLLLGKDFLRLIVIAVLIAVPLGWWVADQWLQSFAYRITPGWWTFATATIIVVAVAILTIGIQAIKAAIISPVKMLRTE
ncbi:MAG: ABC transporter permease [Chitinophagaceae bacterium]